MNTQAFREGFFKAAEDYGLTYEAAVAKYQECINKAAFNDLPLTDQDASDFKDTLRQQGVNPVLSGPNQAYDAQQYNQNLIRTRDELGRKNEDVEAIKGGLGGGAMGAAIGGTGGWLGGHVAKSWVNPKNFNPLTAEETLGKFPGRGRTMGMILGALAGGIPGSVNARHKVELAKKLQNPKNLDYLVHQLEMERQLASNNLGPYNQ